MIRILIADDHEMVRAGLLALLSGVEDMEVIAVATNGHEAIDLAGVHRPAVVLMDLTMPGVDGITATQSIRDAYPDVKVIVLSTFDEPAGIDAALAAGASGYLVKDIDTTVLIAGIRAACTGGAPLSPSVAAHIIRRRVDPPAITLTTREDEILKWAADGLANKQIAHLLGISEKTVKTHFGHIFDRIGVRDRTQAAVWYTRNHAPRPKGDQGA